MVDWLIWLILEAWYTSLFLLAVFLPITLMSTGWACETDDLGKEKMYNTVVVVSVEIPLERHAISASNGITFPFNTACFSGSTEHCWSWTNKHSTTPSKELKQALSGLLTGHRLTAWAFKQAAMLKYAVRGGTACRPFGTSMLFYRNFQVSAFEY